MTAQLIDIRNAKRYRPRNITGVRAFWHGFRNAIATYLARRRERRVNREAFQHMLSLDETMLRDIGVTRNDVLWASRLPLSENAALELEKVARFNRRRN